MSEAQYEEGQALADAAGQDVDGVVLEALTAGLTDEQLRRLLAPLFPGRVRQHKGNSHLEAWDVRRNLLRLFGWGGWYFEVRDVVCILDRSAWPEHPQQGDPAPAVKGGRHSATYRVTGRLTINRPDGTPLCVFEDGAVGDSQRQTEHGAAHDQALKTAMSQALKRCAVNLGDQFGLSLYLEGWEPGQVVVGRSLAHVLPDPPAGPDAPPPAAPAVVEDVTSGELDEQAAAEQQDRQQQREDGAALADQPLKTAADYVTAMTKTRSVSATVTLQRDAGLAGLHEHEVTLPTDRQGGTEQVPLRVAFDRRLARLRASRESQS
jgi:hypothetical protein